MRLPISRHHWYEIADQSWFPSFLRAGVQAALTHFWNLQVILLQPASPSELLASTLYSLLGPSLTSYTFVDFCSGAGGPTPSIEQSINLNLRGTSALGRDKNTSNGIELVRLNGAGKEPRDEGIDFVLTDIHPHLEAWEKAAKRSDHLRYIRDSVDAGNASPDLLSRVEGLSGAGQQKKVFRLFSLAFHHFDDAAATQILRNTLQTSSGFGIFELQERTFEGLLTTTVIGPTLWAGSWYWFWGDWTHLFWTYVVPVIPIVVVLDGWVSSVRTRSGDEIKELMRKGGMEKEMRGWRFESGYRLHTWPTGLMPYFVGVKES